MDLYPGLRLERGGKHGNINQIGPGSLAFCSF